jgi:hypothetical protein
VVLVDVVSVFILLLPCCVVPADPEPVEPSPVAPVVPVVPEPKPVVSVAGPILSVVIAVESALPELPVESLFFLHENESPAKTTRSANLDLNNVFIIIVF